MDEYSAQADLNAANTASGNRFRHDSEISEAFADTRCNQNLYKKDQCSESNHSYNPILQTQNLSAMAPRIRSSQSLRRRNHSGAEQDERDSMPNVNHSITESDSGWILRGTRGGAARQEIGTYASQYHHKRELQKDPTLHSKSVNLHAQESGPW